MRKKIIFIIAFIMVVIFSYTAYAYFYNILDSNSHKLSTSMTNDYVYINNINEFYNAISLDNQSSYNDNTGISISNNRKTLILNNDIILTNNTTILSDCHINMNGKSIDLNGFSLTFKFNYYGMFLVYGNGSIIDSQNINEIYIDCPNACVIFDDNISFNNVDITAKNVSDDLICKAAMKLALSNIINHGVNDFYSTITNDIIQSKDLCTFEHEGIYDYCAYTYTDFDLITNYFTYKDLKIDYTSSNPNILSNYGAIFATGDSILTINVSFKQTSLIKNVYVHSLSEADYEKASIIGLWQHLYSLYYNTEKSKYCIGSAFMLPASDNYFNTNYSFVLNSDLDTSITISKNSVTEYADVYDNYYVLYLDSSINNLKIISDNYNEYSAFDIEATSSKTIDDDYSYALSFVMNEIGNQVTIKDDETYLSMYTEYLLLSNPTLGGYSRLSSVSYSLSGNEDQTYQLENYDDNHNKLAVDITGGVKPYLGQNVFLQVSCLFKESGQTINILVPITYVVSSDSGSGLNPFSPYYVYFNHNFELMTNSYSMENFSIPLTYNNDFPSYAFLIYSKNELGKYERVLSDSGLFTIKIKQNDSEEGIIIDDINSLNLDEYVKNSNTRVYVEINPYYIQRHDTQYYFAYIPIYKNSTNGLYYNVSIFNDTNSYDVYTYYNLDDVNQTLIDRLDNYEYLSLLTIPGIVRYQCDQSIEEEAFDSQLLYELVFDLLQPEEEYVDKETFIYTSRLTQHISEFRITDSNIVSFKGIELLKGLEKLDLSNFNLTNNENWVTDIERISQITNLKSLNLKNTGIYDRQSSSYGLPTGDDTQILQVLSNLNNLEYLDLSNNKIYSFGSLTNFTSLKEVDVSNNTFTYTSTGILGTLLGVILSNIANSIYGSNGSSNQAIFAVLTANGVTVNNGGSQIELNEHEKKIISALTSLEYQDKLEIEQSITDAYIGIDTEAIKANLTYQYEVEYDGETRTKIQYTLNIVDFSPISDDSFAFNIIYDIRYATYSDGWIGGGWSDYEEIEGTPSITFSYSYNVSRY